MISEYDRRGKVRKDWTGNFDKVGLSALRAGKVMLRHCKSERSLNMKKNFCMKLARSSAMDGFAALTYVALVGTVTPSIAAQAKLDTAKSSNLPA